MFKLIKNWYKRFVALLLIPLIILVVVAPFAPARISISGEGILSLESRVALAVNNPPDSEITKQLYQVGDEVIEKRTRSSKTYWLDDNSYSWDGTIGSIHYEDNGWQEIDSYFEPALAPWDWQMLEAGYHIRVKEDFTAGQIIEFEVQGETVQLQPMALEWTNDLDQIQPIAMPHEVAPVITNPEIDLLPAVGVPSHQGTIRWDDAYGEGIDFLWRCTSSRLEKRLEISSLADLPIPEQYILDGGNPVLRLNLIFDPSTGVDIYIDDELWDKKVKVQTFNRIGFWKDGEEQWGFLPLKYWGSGTDLETNEGQSIATLEKRGNKLYISIRVPYGWLQTAVYPVLIDTDIDPQPAQVGMGSDDLHRRKQPTDYFSISSANMYVGYVASANYAWGGGMRFTNISIQQGLTIDTAYLTLLCKTYNGGVNARARISAEKVDNAITFANNQGEFDNRWANRTAQIDWDMALWDVDTSYNSPEIKTVIKEIVDRPGWESGFAVVIFWEDFEDRSQHLAGCARMAYSYDDTPANAAKLHIEYTAEVAEPEAEVAPITWEAGILEVNSAANTAINFFTVTNIGSGDIDIEIKGTDLAGGDDTWDLADNGTPGENIFGLYAGLDDLDDNFDIIIKEDAAYNTLVAGLAEEATQDWGIKLYMPTSVPDYDGQEMTSIVTLIVSAS